MTEITPTTVGDIVGDIQRRLAVLERPPTYDRGGLYDFVEDADTVSVTSFDDLGTVGPTVEGVRLGPSGMLVVTMSATVGLQSDATQLIRGVWMGVDLDWTSIDGTPQNAPATAAESLYIEVETPGVKTYMNTNVSRTIVLTAEPFVDVTVTSKYRRSIGGNGSAGVEDRSLYVQAV